MSYRREFLRGEEKLVVRLEPLDGDRFRVRVGEKAYEVRARALAAGGVRFHLLGADGRPGRACTAATAGMGQALQVRVCGRSWVLQPPETRSSAAAAGDGRVEAPMTGTVLKILVEPGDRVEAEDPLIVLTAMKMEHKLPAGVNGVVETVLVAEGATVDPGALLVEVLPDPR